MSLVSTALVALTVSLAPAPLPTPIRLAAEGEILAWLLAGPFPNAGALEFKGRGFATDYLAPEATAVGVEGQAIPYTDEERSYDPALVVRRGPGWKLGIGDRKAGIDLNRLLDGGKPGIAYCYTELIAPTDVTAQLLFGSDDGAKVWLNGQQVFVKQVARGVKRDEDRVPIALRRGRNTLLFKIEQGNGGWGLLARVVGPDGKPLEGLHQSLQLQPDPSRAPADRWMRKARGLTGTLDLEAAVGYEEVLKRARRFVERFGSDVFEPQKLTAALDQGERDLNRSFSSADELSAELERNRKLNLLAYQRARAPLVARMQNPPPLIATNVAREDYVRVMPGGRYFVHHDGRPFIPIGYNHNPDWPKFEEANPQADRYDPALPGRYFAHLKAHGVNVVRLMIETPPSSNLEDPIGTFRPEHVRWLDAVVGAAHRNGVKLIMTPWDTFWMNLRWDTSTYNPDLGGPLKSKIDFITNPEIRTLQKRRLQYMIDRWGNLGTIFAWEILNEGDLWWGANAAQLSDWAREIAGFVRDYEKRKWGRNHMVSFSFAAAMPEGDMAQFAYRSPLFEYATTHLYIGASKAPKEAVGPALAIAQGVRYALSQIRDTRPYMDTENGPIDQWIADPKFDEEVFHGMTWAHLAAGGAGSGFRWPYRNPHHLTEGMLQTLKRFKTFVDRVDWKRLGGRHVPVTVAGDKGAATVGFGSRQAVLAWTSGSAIIDVTWQNRPAKLNVSLFDCRTGRWLKPSRVQHRANGLSLTMPAASSTAILISG